MSNSTEEFFGKPIYVYTRAQAIADGVLVDVTEQSKDLRFITPVAVSEALWRIIEWPEDMGSEQSTEGRLHDVLFMLRVAISQLTEKDGRTDINFSVILTPRGLTTLKATIGPGDNHEPVITIMLPDED